MLYTRNGWPYVATGAALTEVGLPGVDDTGSVLPGDVAEIFAEFVLLFALLVEPVYMINGWRSPTFNASVGGDPLSNHQSATALDLNGDRHPYEANSTQKYAAYDSGFTPAQVAAIRYLLDRFRGVLYWGMDFNEGYRDAMHFEVRGSASEIHDVVLYLRRNPMTVKVELTDQAIQDIFKTAIAGLTDQSDENENVATVLRRLLILGRGNRRGIRAIDIDALKPDLVAAVKSIDVNADSGAIADAVITKLASKLD